MRKLTLFDTLQLLLMLLMIGIAGAMELDVLAYNIAVSYIAYCLIAYTIIVVIKRGVEKRVKNHICNRVSCVRDCARRTANK